MKEKRCIRKKQIICVCAVFLLLLVIGILAYNKMSVKEENMMFIQGEQFTDKEVQDEVSALEAIEDAKVILNFSNALDELVAIDVQKTDDKGVIYRFQQNYEGIPVYGRHVILWADEKGDVLTLNGNARDIKMDDSGETYAKEADINKSILSYVKKQWGIEEAVEIDKINNESLVVYNMDNVEKGEIAYCVNVYVPQVDTYQFIVNAYTGKILHAYSKTCSNVYPDNTCGVMVQTTGMGQVGKQELEVFKDNEKCYLSDTKRKIQVYVKEREFYIGKYNLVGDFSIDTGELSIVEWNIDEELDDYPVEVDSLANLQKTYDSFYNHLGHKAADGMGERELYVCTQAGVSSDGKETSSDDAWANISDDRTFGLITVGIPKENKYALSVSLDVMAHEYTHLINKYKSGLLGEGEAGAINEACSDIFGEVVEYWNTGGCDWVNGYNEIRNIRAPLAKENPKMYQGENWKNPQDLKKDDGNVHNNSTVISHAAYLMTLPNSGCPGSQLDMDELARLWYKAMLLFPCDVNFMECRLLVEQVALQMYGAQQLTYDQYQRVQNAFDEVGIGRSRSVTLSVSLRPEIQVYDVNDELYENYNVEVSVIEVLQGAEMKQNIMEELTCINGKDQYPVVLQVEAGKCYQITISDAIDMDKKYTYVVMAQEGGKERLEFRTNFGEYYSNAYEAFFAAAHNTTQTGSWVEDMSMTFKTQDGKEYEYNQTTSIDGYRVGDTTYVYLSGAANNTISHEIMRQYDFTYSSNLYYMHYNDSENVELGYGNPGFFDLNSITEDMVLESSVIGDKIDLILDGNKVKKCGLDTYYSMYGDVYIEEYDDLKMMVTIDKENGKIESISIESCPRVEIYRMQAADVEWRIEYLLSEKEAPINTENNIEWDVQMVETDYSYSEMDWIYRYDRKGNVLYATYVEGKMPNTSSLYEYDEWGRLIAEYYASSGTSFSPSYLYEYDEQGIKMLKYVWKNGERKLESMYVYKYDSVGNAVEEYVYDRNNVLNKYYLHTYDQNGNRIEQHIYNADNELDYSVYREYDEDGRMLSSSEVRDNEVQSEYKWEYNEKGDCTKETCIASSYDDYCIIYEYEYSANSTTVHTKDLVESNILEDSWWTYRYEYEYDSDARLVTETRYEDDEFVWMTRYQYFDAEQEQQIYGRWENTYASSMAEQYSLLLNEDMSAEFIGAREKYVGEFTVLENGEIVASFARGAIYNNSTGQYEQPYDVVKIKGEIVGTELICVVSHSDQEGVEYTFTFVGNQ